MKRLETAEEGDGDTFSGHCCTLRWTMLSEMEVTVGERAVEAQVL